MLGMWDSFLNWLRRYANLLNFVVFDQEFSVKSDFGLF